MELEFELASAQGGDAALLWIVVDNLHRLAPEPSRRARLRRALGALIAALPRQGGLIARTEQDALLVFLPQSSAAAGETFARALIDAAGRLAIEDGEAPVRAGLSIGLAATQQDIALYFEALLAVAEEGAAVALASGGDGVVHSELYLLHQRKLERTRPKLAAPAPRNATSPWNTTSASAALPSVPSIPSVSSTSSGKPSSSNESRAATVQGARAELGTEEGFLLEVQRVVAHDSAAHTALVALEPKLMALAQEWARQALAGALAEQETRYTVERTRYEAEREQYERRLTKINQALLATEAELRAIAAAKHIEPGVASSFRHAQGLSASAADYQAKIALLAHILEANLDLRRQLPCNDAA